MKRILSVDDELPVLRCFQRVLEGAGYEVIVTTDTDEALTIMKKGNLDLVMLDISMPKMNGMEIYRLLKKDKKDVVPVLFVTAHPGAFSMQSSSMVETWQKEFTDGNTDMLYKPFDINILLEKVESLIGPGEDAK
jgi:DNA-binding response OmpR family regulator